MNAQSRKVALLCRGGRDAMPRGEVKAHGQHTCRQMQSFCSIDRLTSQPRVDKPTKNSD